MKSPESTQSHRPATTMKYDLLIYYQNVGGMNTSIYDYCLACSDSSYDIFAFTETWLNDNTLSQQIFGPSYVVYRLDRSRQNSNKLSGGGVLLAVNSKLVSRELFAPDGRTVEQIWATISLDNRKIYIGNCYIPPDLTNDSAVMNRYILSIHWITKQMDINDNILLLGDFNLPCISWTLNASNYM